jgi:hypothetical protein
MAEAWRDPVPTNPCSCVRTSYPTTGLPGKENHISATFVQLTKSQDEVLGYAPPPGRRARKDGWPTTELIQLANDTKPVVFETAISDDPKAKRGTSATRTEEPPRPTPQNTGRAPRWTRRILCGRLLAVILFEVIVASLIEVFKLPTLLQLQR